MTFGANTGMYTKIGRLVYVTLHMYVTGRTGGAGVARITGLPFTIDAASVSYHSGGVGYANDFIHTPRGLLFEDNTSRIRMYRANAASAATGDLNTEVAVTDIQAASDIYLFGAYFTD